ncbi:MAG: hypothetical protein DKT66_10355 [Candidatus Melainabacteria bacterium]|nr:MAG: hypothetical protein DKT66_10355 [Candidatus Melainabacteria bacterium]
MTIVLFSLEPAVVNRVWSFRHPIVQGPWNGFRQISQNFVITQLLTQIAFHFLSRIEVRCSIICSFAEQIFRTSCIVICASVASSFYSTKIRKTLFAEVGINE